MSTDSLAPSLDPLRRGLAAVERLRPTLRSIQETATLDRVEMSGSIDRVGDVDVAQLMRLAADGHAVEITAEENDWVLSIRADGPTAPLISTHGHPQAALPGSSIATFNRAIARGDAADALTHASEIPGSIRVVLRNDATNSGAHWVASVARLASLLTAPGWSQIATGLAAEPSLVIVDDAGDSTLSAEGLLLVGPQSLATARRPASGDLEYRRLMAEDGRLALPSPTLFANPVGSGSLATLTPALHGLTRSLIWYWLCSEATVASDGSVTGVIAGARTVRLSLTPELSKSSSDDLALYRWTSALLDPARHEATQQAASLALVSPTDLTTAARPALRTAKSLYELARRGAVGEALAARRAARDAAMRAARDAGASARQAAGKSVERTLVQLAAGVAVILSSSADVIGRTTGTSLLVVIALMAVVTLLVTLKVELLSAEDALTNELADLDQYRDTLSSADIGAIREMSAIGVSKRDLRRARTTAELLYGGTAVIVVIVGLLLAINTTTHGKTEPNPSPSNSARTTSTR